MAMYVFMEPNMMSACPRSTMLWARSSVMWFGSSLSNVIFFSPP